MSTAMQLEPGATISDRYRLGDLIGEKSDKSSGDVKRDPRPTPARDRGGSSDIDNIKTFKQIRFPKTQKGVGSVSYPVNFN